MSKILLIHGFGVGVRKSLLEKVRFTNDSYFSHSGFGAFLEQLSNKEAELFIWSEESDFKWLSFLSPLKNLRLYQREKIAATSEALQKRLQKVLQENSYESIICHSMGCYLLLNYINDFGLPENIKRVVLVQGDFDSKLEIKNENILKRIEAKDISFTNVYCYWDPSLLCSKIINKYDPAGLTGWKSQYIKNKFIPLYRTLNPHLSSINDKRLLEFLSFSRDKDTVSIP